MRLPLHHAEVPVITNIRPMRPALPLRRHPINRTSLRIQRLPTLPPENDESHKQKDHRKQNNSQRLLASRHLFLCLYPPHPQNPQISPGKKREAQARAHASPLSAVSYFLHPEQEAQQSSDAQQPACAAVAAPARPSAITAINTTTLSFFMIFLLCI
jgi:hypothetical protein